MERIEVNHELPGGLRIQLIRQILERRSISIDCDGSGAETPGNSQLRADYRCCIHVLIGSLLDNATRLHRVSLVVCATARFEYVTFTRVVTESSEKVLESRPAMVRSDSDGSACSTGRWTARG